MRELNESLHVIIVCITIGFCVVTMVDGCTTQERIEKISSDGLDCLLEKHTMEPK